MAFPFHFGIAGLQLPAHPVLEVLAYFIGARIYFSLRERSGEPALPLHLSLWLLVGCIFGAWIGSRLLAWLESPQFYLETARSQPLGLLGSKTIVGGLLGGWAGVELAKLRLGIRQSTGDLFVWPLAAGTAIGRVGCFLRGLADRTHGIATGLPWGVDFGDGLRRHPTQLYECLFVLVLASVVTIAARPDWRAGARFRWYFAGYFLFRFLVEFIKPRETTVAGLSAIQLASLVGTGFALISLCRPVRR